MRKLRRSIAAAALFLTVAAPGFAGIHYKATTSTQDAASKTNQIQVESWVSGDSAKIVFLESGGNPVAQEGTYILTKDGGRTLYLVNPEEKSYAKWDLQGMLGTMGAVMNGMGPLLKIQFSNVKVEKVSEGDGGTLLGLPTRNSKYRTSYTMTIKVLGMGNTSDVVTDQEVWSTTKLQDAGLGVWLRAEPPRTGNAEFDKLINADAYKLEGFPLKIVAVSTQTSKKGKSQTTRSTMEVTQLDANAAVPATTFEIPKGYEETQILPSQGAEQQGEGQQEEKGGLRGLLKPKKPPVE
ncbi:MAG TPA: DUF4412 domain-containing protein [Thermoanaerobaculia bacterium]